MELVRLYSNPAWSAGRLLLMRRDALTHRRSHPQPARRVPQRVDRRLGNETLERIVVEYVAGAPTTALVRTYGIGKGTLLRLLREHRVSIRHQHRR
jgi:hypothetical protein